MVDRKLVASGLLEALETADRELRERMPRAFRTVDKIASAPDWVPFADQHDWSSGISRMFGGGECAWCGDDFIAPPRSANRPPKMYCGPACANDMRAWLRRRVVNRVMPEGAPMQLGKQPYRDDHRTLKLAKYLDVPALPPVPATLHRANLVPSWPVYLNDQLGDCTCAEVGHHEQLFSAMQGREQQVSDSAVLALYEKVSGYNPATGANDDGAVILDVMTAWRKVGCGGHKIGAFAEVNIDDDHLLRAAMFLFGGVSVGLAMPAFIRDHVEQGSTAQWYRPHNLTGDNAPGTWGGHCVLLCDYDAHGLTCITWGRLQRMSWAFWHTYADEAWAALSWEWITAGKTAPSGVDIAALRADLQAIAA